MVDLNPNISVITLNINGLNTLIKGQRLLDWMKRQEPTVSCLEENNFKYKDTNKLKKKMKKNIYHANTNKKKLGDYINIRQGRFQSKDYYQR